MRRRRPERDLTAPPPAPNLTVPPPCTATADRPERCEQCPEVAAYCEARDAHVAALIAWADRTDQPPERWLEVVDRDDAPWCQAAL